MEKLLTNDYRKLAWQKATGFIGKISKVIDIKKVTVLGSFTTKKERPADVDFIVMVTTGESEDWSVDVQFVPDNKFGVSTIDDASKWMEEKYGAGNYEIFEFDFKQQKETDTEKEDTKFINNQKTKDIEVNWGGSGLLDNFTGIKRRLVAYLLEKCATMMIKKVPGYATDEFIAAIIFDIIIQIMIKQDEELDIQDLYDKLYQYAKVYGIIEFRDIDVEEEYIRDFIKWYKK